MILCCLLSHVNTVTFTRLYYDQLSRDNIGLSVLFPKAKTMRPQEFVDSSFVQKLDDEVFFERVYKR